METTAWIGLGQLTVALLIWLNIGPNRFKVFLSQMARRQKLVWVLLVGGLAFSLFAVYRSYHNMGRYEYNDDAKLETITDRTYQNEEVGVDGREHLRCTFENVTLRYNGTTPLRVRNCAFRGTFRLKTDNGAVGNTAVLLKGMGLLKPDFKIYGGPNRHPLGVEPPTPER